MNLTFTMFGFNPNFGSVLISHLTKAKTISTNQNTAGLGVYLTRGAKSWTRPSKGV